MMKKFKITVFTPTYNRRDLIKRCYDSLECQGNKNFEWLVVDDGSTDGTGELIAKLKRKATFAIKYLYQENGGKHRAFNLAVRKCDTDFMLILDSDDMLTKNCIEVLEDRCGDLLDNSSLCGIIGNRAYLNGEIIGSRMVDAKYVSGLELYQKMNFVGDTLRLYKTSILRQYPFPEIDGENFVSENVIFDKIDQKYKMLPINEVLYLCEYQETGLTKNTDKIKLKNPVGHSLSLKSTAETALTLKKKIGATALYILWTKRFHIEGAFRQYRDKVFYLGCLPISFVFWVFKAPKFYFDIFKEDQND